MTPAEALGIVSLLRSAWPAQARDLTDEAGGVYATFLADAEHADAATAVSDLITTSRRLPSIAELREATADAKRRREDRSATDALRLPARTSTGEAEALHRKGRMQLDNLRRWSMAVGIHADERDRRRKGFPAPTPDESDAKLHRATVAMMRESGRIYAEERPFARDGGDMQASIERDISSLRGRPGALVGTVAGMAGEGW